MSPAASPYSNGASVALAKYVLNESRNRDKRHPPHSASGTAVQVWFLQRAVPARTGQVAPLPIGVNEHFWCFGSVTSKEPACGKLELACGKLPVHKEE